MKPSLNIARPYVTDDGLKEYRKNYYQENIHNIKPKRQIYRDNRKEQKNITDKIYRENNKELIAERRNKYYQENKDYVIQKVKQYREDNSEKVKERVKSIEKIIKTYIMKRVEHIERKIVMQFIVHVVRQLSNIICIVISKHKNIKHI